MSYLHHTRRIVKALYEDFIHKLQSLAPSDLPLMAFFIGVCLPLSVASVPSGFSLVALFFVSIILFLSSSVLSKRFDCTLVAKAVRCLAILMIGFSFSAYSISIHRSNMIAPELEGKNLRVAGSVIGVPAHHGDSMRFNFKLEGMEIENQWRKEFKGRTIKVACFNCLLSIKTGQRWLFTVRMKRPNGFASWGAFDYEKYLFRHRVVATAYIRQDEENRLLAQSAGGFDHLRSRIKKSVLEQAQGNGSNHGMLMALMIGDRSLQTQAQRDVYQVVGISHLLAISGLHIGLVFMMSSWLVACMCWPFPKVYLHIPKQTLVLLPSLLAAYGYSGLAGFSISTQRALIMLCVYVGCKLLGRELSLQRVLLLAVVIILVYDPFSILDIGFWLSSFAVLLIAVISEKNPSLKLWQLQPWLWIGMLPMTAMFFGKTSLISVVVNLVAVPLFCLILIPLVLLNLSVFLFFSESLAQQGFHVLGQVFTVIDQVIAGLANLPFAAVYPKEISWWQVCILTCLLFISVFKQKTLVACLIFGFVWHWPSPKTMSPSQYLVTTLDVGQGLSIVIELDNYVLVYDTGPKFKSGFTTAKAVVLPYLRARGIAKIDTLIISHADNDHIGGLDELLAGIRVDDILTSRVDKVGSLAKSCKQGQIWRVGEVSFEIISPAINTPSGSNNQSCVLAIDNGKLRTLITGDIEKQVERFLVAEFPRKLKSDFVLVPHQGSKTSSTPLWLDAVSPKLAFVAAGYRNHYGHPHSDVVQRYEDRGIELYSTKESGSIRLDVNDDSWLLEEYRLTRKHFWHR